MMEFTYDPPDVPLSVLHIDGRIIVLDKPAGLLSVPGKLEGREDCLIARLVEEYPEAPLVHRLDCDTSGVMIFQLPIMPLPPPMRASCRRSTPRRAPCRGGAAA